MYVESMCCEVYVDAFLLTELVLAVHLPQQQHGTADQDSYCQPNRGM